MEAPAIGPRKAPQHRARWIAFGCGAIAVFAISLALWPVVQSGRRQYIRQETRTRLQQIGRALRSYHDQYGCFPPAYVTDQTGERLHSWRVLLLPHLGEERLYSAYRFDEPWNSPANQLLWNRMPNAFRDPKQSGGEHTRFLAVVDRRCAWPEQYAATLSDFTDGANLTVHVVEAPQRVIWTQPGDLDYDEACRLLPAIIPERGLPNVLHVLLADGRVRAISGQIDARTWRWLLTARSGKLSPRGDWGTARAAYRFGPALPADALPSTVILPYVSAPIAEGKNCVWCATFQIGWDQCPSAEAATEGSFLAELQRRPFDRQNLSADAYLARAGVQESGIVDEIRSALAQRFPESAPTVRAPQAVDSYVIYAFLHKSLPFAQQFADLQDPLSFRGTKETWRVRCFGYERAEADAGRDRALRQQITVLDCVSDDDFILSLATQAERDEIILAAVTPQATLERTWDVVRQRIARGEGDRVRREFSSADTLRVPRLLVNVERNYDELLNCACAGRPVSVAQQTIRFRLDEAGAVLESEAEIIGEFGEDAPPALPAPRHFAFDRPFLLALQERGAAAPYFLMWVAHAELMERAAPTAARAP